MFKGITKRWILNTLSVIITIIVFIVVALILVVTYMFQNSVQQSRATAQTIFLRERATMLRTSTKRNRWALWFLIRTARSS